MFCYNPSLTTFECLYVGISQAYILCPRLLGRKFSWDVQVEFFSEKHSYEIPFRVAYCCRDSLCNYQGIRAEYEKPRRKQLSCRSGMYAAQTLKQSPELVRQKCIKMLRVQEGGPWKLLIKEIKKKVAKECHLISRGRKGVFWGLQMRWQCCTNTMYSSTFYNKSNENWA